jgi:protein SCO1/2
MSASINNIVSKNWNIDDIEFLFITTDPKRDTTKRMARYLSDYNPKIIGLTGKHSDLKKVWKNFFVHVLPANEVTAVDHAMDHRRGSFK